MKLIEIVFVVSFTLFACVGIITALVMIWGSLFCLWQGFKQRRELKRPLENEYWGDE